MAFKILTEKQRLAVARKLKGLPAHGQCKVIRKVSGKALPFGTLSRGVSVEVCRAFSAGKDVVIARSFGPKRGGASKDLRGASRRKRRR